MSKVQHLTKKDFIEKVADINSSSREWKFLGTRPALIDFYASWCGPCKGLAPVLEELAEEYSGLVDIYKVDVDAETELAAAFGVRSIPTLVFAPLQGMPSVSAGALPKDVLKRAIREQLGV